MTIEANQPAMGSQKGSSATPSSSDDGTVDNATSVALEAGNMEDQDSSEDLSPERDEEHQDGKSMDAPDLKNFSL